MNIGSSRPAATTASADHEGQRARLRFFLNWMTLATLAFSTFEMLVFLIIRDDAFGVAAVACFTYLAALVIARKRAQHGEVQRAVIIVSVALLALTIVATLTWPNLIALNALLPFLAVILALPYLTGRSLKRLMIASWLVSALVAILGNSLPHHSQAPTWLVNGFYASALSVGAGLLLILLWLFSSRLNETLHDIEETGLALRESEARFRATFEQAAVGIAHVAPDGGWLRVNQKLCEIVGYTREELLQRTFQDITYPPDLLTDLNYVQRVLAGEVQSYTMEKRYMCKDGNLTWVQLTVALVRKQDGKPDYFISVIQDINQRKQIQEDRDRLYTEMQAALKARDEFFLLAAHELKTPMTTILGSAQLLQRRLEQMQAATERERRTARALVDQGRRLHRLVLALLDLSRIQHGTLTLERSVINLGALTSHMLEELQPTLRHHRLEARIPAQPCFVLGDKLRLEEILQNLLQNAIKYSPAGGRIVVEIRCQGDTAALIVTDQGIGIPEVEVEHIFERFYRASNVERRQLSGMGIGLYVVKELVTLHGGTIEVDSSEGQGSTFRVQLPLCDYATLQAALEDGTGLSTQEASHL